MLDNRLDIYFAIFAIDYSDRQYELQAKDPNGGFVEGIINAGDSTQWGLESDFTFAISENWIVSGGIGYVNAEWENGTTLEAANADLSGKTPPNISDFSSSLALEYYKSLTNDLEFSARLGMQYKGASSTNSQFFPGGVIGEFENPSFTVFNFNATLEWEQVKISLMVENFTDELYYVDVQEFPNFAGSALLGPAEGIIIGTLEQPRRAKLSFEYSF
jgi:iron complex outermembrane receptor protein